MNDTTICVTTPKIKTDGFEPLGVGVHRASTIVFSNAAAYASRGKRGSDGYSYGLYGTPTTRTLEAKLTALECGVRTFLTPSGQASNAMAILAFVASGDRILIADTSYPPVRDFADEDLRRLGVDVAYYDPTSPEDVAQKIDDRTKIVWCESPGSTTMEVQDLPRIVAIAHARGALVGCDNTWATPLNYKPLTLGADLVTEALTKSVSGHGDVLMGSLSVKDELLVPRIRSVLGRFGIGVSPDDAALVLRGFETLPLRLKHAAAGAEALIALFQRHPCVAEVLYPALPDSPGHALWRRDFRGSSGVFSVVFQDVALPHVATALDALKTFAIGASWGSTRSLVAPMSVDAYRTATHSGCRDPILRISVGLEDLEDLQWDVANILAAISSKVDEAGRTAA